MLDKLPIKKEYLLIAGALLLLLISYRFAFKNTVAAWQTNRDLKAKIAQSTDLSYQPGYLERKNANLNKLIDLYKADTTLFRNNIISTISSIAEEQNVKLTGVPVQDISYSESHAIVEKLFFEGDYFSLLKVIKQLQLTGSIGVLRAETFKTVGSRQKNEEIKKLRLELLLEIIRPSN